jgi:peptide/nickel transport system permease protein
VSALDVFTHRVMFAFLLRKILDLIITMWGVCTIVFIALRVTGDPIDMMLPPEATDTMIQEMRHSLGFDKPLYVQYVEFIEGALCGDLGDSFFYHRPAVELIAHSMPATVELASVAMLLATVIAIPAGILAAVRRNSLVDRLVMLLTLFGQSMPFFWLGIMMILLFAVNWGLLPTSGYGTFAQLVMPAITLAAYAVSQIARLVRSSMLDVLGEEYIVVARSKGLTETVVILRHALKNAAIPVVTMIGLYFGVLLGGTVVTETIFAWPGLGRLIVNAIYLRDYPVVQAGVLYLALTFVLINGLLDASYGILDPRIRQG